jgi:hypothetical protein
LSGFSTNLREKEQEPEELDGKGWLVEELHNPKDRLLRTNNFS